MRGDDQNQSAMFSYMSAEERVPMNHPLRGIRQMMGQALQRLSPQLEGLYSRLGRPSIAPEKLLRALLLQVLYSIRSERMLMEQLQYNLLFRWFVGLNLDDPVWDATVFSKNRERLLKGGIAQALFQAVLEQARENELLSDEHFTVDGTLLEAWASKKSYQKKEDPPEKGSGYRKAVLKRDTHECTSDPDAVLYRKSSGGAYQLCHMAHVLMENRRGLPVAARVTRASTEAEWEAALEMLKSLPGSGRKTVGADAGYDYPRFVEAVRALQITPHVAPHPKGVTSLDGRTTRHAGYAISLNKRKRIEHIFGWLKTVGNLRKLRHRGRALVEWMLTLTLSAYNLVRMRTIAIEAANG